MKIGLRNLLPPGTLLRTDKPSDLIVLLRSASKFLYNDLIYFDDVVEELFIVAFVFVFIVLFVVLEGIFVFIFVVLVLLVVLLMFVVFVVFTVLVAFTGAITGHVPHPSAVQLRQEGEQKLHIPRH